MHNSNDYFVFSKFPFDFPQLFYSPPCPTAGPASLLARLHKKPFCVACEAIWELVVFHWLT